MGSANSYKEWLVLFSIENGKAETRRLVEEIYHGKKEKLIQLKSRYDSRKEKQVYLPSPEGRSMKKTPTDKRSLPDLSNGLKGFVDVESGNPVSGSSEAGLSKETGEFSPSDNVSTNDQNRAGLKAGLPDDESQKKTVEDPVAPLLKMVSALEKDTTPLDEKRTLKKQIRKIINNANSVEIIEKCHRTEGREENSDTGTSVSGRLTVCAQKVLVKIKNHRTLALLCLVCRFMEL